MGIGVFPQLYGAKINLGAFDLCAVNTNVGVAAALCPGKGKIFRLEPNTNS